MTARRMRWEREKEAEEKARKAGKPRPILAAALREWKKEEAARKKAEDAAAAVKAESEAEAKPPPDAPSDP